MANSTDMRQRHGAVIHAMLDLDDTNEDGNASCATMAVIAVAVMSRKYHGHKDPVGAVARDLKWPTEYVENAVNAAIGKTESDMVRFCEQRYLAPGIEPRRSDKPLSDLLGDLVSS